MTTTLWQEKVPPSSKVVENVIGSTLSLMQSFHVYLAEGFVAKFFNNTHDNLIFGTRHHPICKCQGNSAF